MAVAKPGSGETDYEEYIRTSELLRLQKARSELVNPDEVMFIVTHQSMELWMKVADYEILKARECLHQEELVFAHRHIDRIGIIIDLVAEGLKPLKTMTQADYHSIRQALGRGSGQDSPGFNKILNNLPTLHDPFMQLLEKRGISLLTLFKEPHVDAHELIYSIAMKMMEADRAFQEFRYKHIHLAKQHIGLKVKSLKGVPAKNLEKGILQEVFPDLWRAVEDFTLELKTQY